MTSRTGFRFLSAFATMILAQIGFAGIPASAADLKDWPVLVDLRHVFRADPSGVKAISDHELAQLRGTGFLSSFISNIVAALPEDNTVVIQADGFSDQSSGSGTQTLSFDNGTTTITATASSTSSFTIITSSSSN